MKLRSKRRLLNGFIFIAGLFCFAIWGKLVAEDGSVDVPEVHFSRRLQSAQFNCTPPAIEQFPQDIFSKVSRKHGALLIHVAVSLYMFQALALVCDDYFVPALERICQILNLKPDVAGATFMAAGSSAPELAAAVIGVFIAKNDIGLGTVVGSAVFNILFVIGLCAIFAGMVVHLDWWPLVRDCSSYAISIVALVIVIYDEQVHWYEALVLLILYLFYIILMYFNGPLETWMHANFATNCTNQKKVNTSQYLLTNTSEDRSADSEESDSESVSIKFHTNGAPASRLTCTADMNSEHFQINVTGHHTHIDSEPDSVFAVPNGKLKLILWVVSLPLILVMFLTVPDCRKEYWKKCFVVTFLMSLVWISAYSFLLVWMIAIIGHTLDIPDTIMGLTFMAAGVSIPDAVASLIVVRDGYGDMAVSNAVGSNVFDILLCLGLPWFLDAVIHNDVIAVYSGGLVYSSITLLSTVVFILFATYWNGWKLDKKYGITLLVAYVLFMILASLYELNIFSDVHPPECPTMYD